jgi:hypothetical protein
MELAGAPSGNHDVLDVVGIADVDGELEVTAINGFAPDVGDFYTLVTGASVTGTFDTLTLLSDNIFKFDGTLSYPGTRVVLRIDDVSMFGDFDNDMTLDCADIDALVAEIAGGGMGAEFDLNDDMAVDIADLNLWLEEAGTFNVGGAYLPGDANLDGTVDLLDFDEWNSHKFTSNASWCSGDFNADGFIDGFDALIWNQFKFLSSDTAAAVPEPGCTCYLLALVGLIGGNSRRRLATFRKQAVMM